MISVSLTAKAVRRGLFAAAVSSVAFTSISFAADAYSGEVERLF